MINTLWHLCTKKKDDKKVSSNPAELVFLVQIPDKRVSNSCRWRTFLYITSLSRYVNNFLVKIIFYNLFWILSDITGQKEKSEILNIGVKLKRGSLILPHILIFYNKCCKTSTSPTFHNKPFSVKTI